MSNGANKYKKASVMTATQPQLLIMLYEGAIRFVISAKNHLKNNDLEGKGVAIGRAHDIINELIASLNHEVGGEISKDLESLYNFIVETLIKANVENSVTHLETVENILKTLLEGWKGAVEKVSKGEAVLGREEK